MKNTITFLFCLLALSGLSQTTIFRNPATTNQQPNIKVDIAALSTNAQVAISATNDAFGRPLTNMLTDAPKQISNLRGWFRADAFSGVLTNGSSVTSWPDWSATNSPFLSYGGGKGYFFLDGIADKPAILFDGQSTYMTNSGPSNGTNFALFLVYADYGESNVVTSLGADTNTWYATFYVNSYQSILGTTPSGIRANWGTNNVAQVESHAALKRPVFICLNFDGTNETMYLNGHHIVDSAFTKLYTTQCLNLGGLKNQGGFWNGFIAEAIIYDRSLSRYEIETVQDYIENRYHFLKGEIILDGDSEMVGIQAAPKGGLCNVLATNFGSRFDVNDVAIAGQTSTQRTNNLNAWMGDVRNSNPTIVVYEIGVNDFRQAASLALVQTNVINYCTWQRQLGKMVVMCSLPTFTNEQTGANSRTNFNAWLQSNWSGFCDGLADYGSDALIGPQGGFTNSTYFNVDWVHRTNAAYQVESSYVVATINSILGNSMGNFSGTFSGNGSSITNLNGNTFSITATNRLVFSSVSSLTNTLNREATAIVTAGTSVALQDTNGVSIATIGTIATLDVLVPMHVNMRLSGTGVSAILY